MIEKFHSGRSPQSQNFKRLCLVSMSLVLVFAFLIPLSLSGDRASRTINEDARYYPGKGDDWKRRKPEECSQSQLLQYPDYLQGMFYHQ